MKRFVALFCMLLVLSMAVDTAAQNRDGEMINASLRFIKERARLTKKEYKEFAGIYIKYNEQLVALNRELKPDAPDYLDRWNDINARYMEGLEKNLEDTTRTKIGIAQFELGQKIWKQWAERNQREMDAQTQMWIRSAQANRQFMMMQPQVMDARRRNIENMENFTEQQRQWWENYWKNWQRPDSLQGVPSRRGMPPVMGPRRNMPAAPNDSAKMQPLWWMRPGTPMRPPMLPVPVPGVYPDPLHDGDRSAETSAHKE